LIFIIGLFFAYQGQLASTISRGMHPSFGKHKETWTI